jgi:hypothetical protein
MYGCSLEARHAREAMDMASAKPNSGRGNRRFEHVCFCALGAVVRRFSEG